MTIIFPTLSGHASQLDVFSHAKGKGFQTEILICQSVSQKYLNNYPIDCHEILYRWSVDDHLIFHQVPQSDQSFYLSM